jgi:ribosomal protein S18 acetylase RimI-like enzyme
VTELADAEGGSLGFADYLPESTAAGPRPPIHIRTATALDFSGILAVQAESARPSIEPWLLNEIVHNPIRLLLVALDDGVVVGWAKTHHWPMSDGIAGAGHYLGGVTVAPGHRRKGIANALTARRLEWIGNRARDAWFIVNATNLASIELHRRWGFEEEARNSSFHGIKFTGGTGILFHASIKNDLVEPDWSH